VPGLKIEEQAILMPPTGDQWLEVIGVAGSARNRGVAEAPEPAIYIPYSMVTIPGGVFLLRTAVEPHSIIRAVREQVHAVDSDLPVTQILTLEDYLSQFERAYPRFSTTLFSIFAAVGLLLAASGLYSVVSYTVARRTPEFGIRIALGAQRRHVLQIVFASVTALMAIGAVIGLVTSWALSSLIARYIEGWKPRDLWAYVAVVAVLGIVAIVACIVPARRATSISPMSALRHE
jgi:ABC-type antimicrobial peptide transport system permease subunit